jgi:hypothetical protein
MTRATPSRTPTATPNCTTPNGNTTRDLSGTARGQIEFSLDLLRIASPGEPVNKPQRDSGAARIRALEELLGGVTSDDATRRQANRTT